MTHSLGQCPKCRAEIASEVPALPLRCPHCGFELRPARPEALPCIASVLRKSFCFRGRATRAEFWWACLARFIFKYIVFLGGVVAMSCVTGIPMVELLCTSMPTTPETFPIVAAVQLLQLLSAIPLMSVAVRRLHDIGHIGLGAYILFGAPLLTALMLVCGGLAYCILIYPPLEILLAVTGVYVFICALIDSCHGPNKYGPSAKYPAE